MEKEDKPILKLTFDFSVQTVLYCESLEETKYWLEICKQIDSNPDCNYLIIKLSEIRKILTKTLATSKNNLKKIIISLLNY